SSRWRSAPAAGTSPPGAAARPEAADRRSIGTCPARTRAATCRSCSGRPRPRRRGRSALGTARRRAGAASPRSPTGPGHQRSLASRGLRVARSRDRSSRDIVAALLVGEEGAEVEVVRRAGRRPGVAIVRAARRGHRGRDVGAGEEDAVGAGEIAERPGVHVAVAHVRRPHEYRERRRLVAPLAPGYDERAERAGIAGALDQPLEAGAVLALLSGQAVGEAQRVDVHATRPAPDAHGDRRRGLVRDARVAVVGWWVIEQT